MANSKATRHERPLVIPSTIQLSDLQYFNLSQLPSGILDALPAWFHLWRYDHACDDNAITHLGEHACPVLKKFAIELFRKSKPTGILIVSNLERDYKIQYFAWLVLEQEGHDKIDSVEGLMKSPPGTYYFLHEPKAAGPDNLAGDELLRRFFLVFGGLRDSVPFFGGDGFLEWPSEVSSRALISRIHVENAWIGSKRLHKRGNVDSLILSSAGLVGYLPIEPERSIQIYAQSFSDAIMKWLDDPLRCWDATVC